MAFTFTTATVMPLRGIRSHFIRGLGLRPMAGMRFIWACSWLARRLRGSWGNGLIRTRSWTGDARWRWIDPLRILSAGRRRGVLGRGSEGGFLLGGLGGGFVLILGVSAGWCFQGIRALCLGCFLYKKPAKARSDYAP